MIRRKSLAMPSMPLSIASSVEEIVISLTGNANLPSSIQKPAAPREKSEVKALKPKPIISVTYSPLGVLAITVVARVLPAELGRSQGRETPLDIAGIAVLTASLGLILVGLNQHLIDQ